MPREMELTPFDTLSLGSLIELLQRRATTERVRFDFCGCVPKKPQSYRGYYDHLALGWDSNWSSVTVELLIAELQDAIGKTFEGYKGGGYVMRIETPIWVDNYGHASGTSIVGVSDGEGITILETGCVR